MYEFSTARRRQQDTFDNGVLADLYAHVPEPPGRDPDQPPEIPPLSPDEDIDLPPREDPSPVRDPEKPRPL